MEILSKMKLEAQKMHYDPMSAREVSPVWTAVYCGNDW